MVQHLLTELFNYLLGLSLDGGSLEGLLGQNPIFLVNPIFLYFCLLLLKNQNRVPLANREKAYHSLRMFVAKRLDCIQFDLKDIAELYPPLDYACFLT